MMYNAQYVQHHEFAVLGHSWTEAVILTIFNYGTETLQLSLYEKGSNTPLIEIKKDENYRFETDSCGFFLMNVDGIHSASPFSEAQKTGIPGKQFGGLRFFHNQQLALILRINEGNHFVDIEITEKGILPLIRKDDPKNTWKYGITDLKIWYR